MPVSRQFDATLEVDAITTGQYFLEVKPQKEWGELRGTALLSQD